MSLVEVPPAPDEPGLSSQSTRSLSDAYSSSIADSGEEGRDLAALARARIGLGSGWVVEWDGAIESDEIRGLVERGIEERGAVVIRALWQYRFGEERFRRRFGALAPIRELGELAQQLVWLSESPEAPGRNRARRTLSIRVIPVEQTGFAASVDPVNGDPEQLGVWTGTSLNGRWRIDRRSMRVTKEGAQTLVDADASRAADLADRAQLVLGHPVHMEWASTGGQISILSIRDLPLQPTFTAHVWRRLALVDADEHTVTPLAVDCLDRALRRGDAPSGLPRVRRVYGRPYRRVDPAIGLAVATGDSGSLARASTRVARMMVDVTAPITAAKAFQSSLDDRLASVDAESLRSLDNDALRMSLRRRCELSAEALALLDRQREATRTLLAAMEMILGNLPQECYPALAAPRLSRRRRRIHEKLARLAVRIDAEAPGCQSVDELPRSLRKRWDDLRESLVNIRPRGIDVSHNAMGASAEDMWGAVRIKLAADLDAEERVRRDAIRRLRATARGRPFGRARESIAAS